DQNLLPQLAGNPRAGVHYALTDSRSDALNVFKFAADNTNVEWDVHKFTENNTIKYSIGTDHDRLSSPGAEKMGHSGASVIASMHSHPSAEPDRRSEMYSMGMDINPWTGEYNKPVPLRSDYYLKWISDSKSLDYVYMKKSRNLWQIIYRGTPVLKGNIKKSNDFPF
ncbi:MAG: hypothetical protein FWF54_05485, partial [Candidatus Azobacteroides sp.]|nr:hypothetical protein [Candidatus Azobacteroides sp.]